MESLFSIVPTYKEWKTFKKEKGLDNPDPKKSISAYRKYFQSNEHKNFKYGDDMKGYKCPLSSHLRRANPRDYLDPLNDIESDNPNSTTCLNNRRRILRRGLPYGSSELEKQNDETEQGTIFMAICSSICRQFEFIQQQWIEYALDYNEGNNTCPIIGNHTKHKNYIIASDPSTGKQPYIMSKLKTFVEARGGDYFFLPSISTLRMMSIGAIDPT